MALVVFGLTRIMLNSRLRDAESAQTQHRLTRIDQGMDELFKTLQSHVTDYGCWDSSLEYMQNRNLQYLERTYHPYFFRNFDLNLVAAYDLRGRLVFIRTHNLTRQQLEPVSSVLIDGLKQNSDWIMNDTRPFDHALMSLPNRLMMVAKAPIWSSTREGKPAGVLIMGRYFTDRVSAELSLLMDLPLTFEVWPGEAHAAAVHEHEDNPLTSDPFRPARIFNDLRGTPALLIELNHSRAFYQQADEVIWKFLLALSAMGLVVLLVMNRLIRIFILDRIALLNQTCAAIATQGDLERRLPVRGNDELGQLNVSINQMLDGLEKSRQDRQTLEMRFLTLVEQSHTGVYMMNATRFLYVNHAFAEMFGYEVDELLSGEIAPYMVVLPEDRPMMLENIRRRLAGEIDAIHYTLRLVRKNGTIFYAEVYGRRALFRGELAIHGMQHDITMRVQAEEAARAQRNFLQSMIDNLPLGVFVKRASDRRYVLWNRHASEAMGLPMDKVLGQRADDWMTPEVARRINEEDECLLRECRVRDIPELMVQVPGQEPRILHQIKVPVLGPDGQPMYIIGIVEDITKQVQRREEHQQLELRMQQAQKLESLGVLAGGIAHDFNNLLVGILGNIQLAGRFMGGASPALDYLGNAETAVQRAAELCQQLLGYAGKGRFLIQRINLASVVGEMAKLLEVSVHHRAELKVELEFALPSVEVDVTQLRQVMMNLITNAADSMEHAHGCITIRTGWQSGPAAPQPDEFQVGSDPEGAAVWFEVADTGCGMDRETLNRIFDPFYTTKMMGRGLGLAAVQGIIHSHGGAIRVYTRPGAGSCFRILLPAAGPLEPVHDGEFLLPGEATPAVADAPPQGRHASSAEPRQVVMTGQLLVIDDEAPVREVTQAILESVGYRVLVAVDGEDGLRLFRQHGDIAAVLLDLTMPGLPGEEVFARLIALRPEIPIILMSGYAEDDILSRFGAIKPVGFLHKPFQFDELVDLINRLMSRPRPPAPEGGDIPPPQSAPPVLGTAG
jgi:PAS domain S-box-containing protein